MENNTQIRRLNLQYNLLAKNSLKILEKTVHNNLLLIDLKLKEKPMDLNGMRFDALPPAQLKSIDDCVRDNQLIAKVPPPPRVPRFASMGSHAGKVVAGEGNQLRVLNRRLERIPLYILNCVHLTQIQIAGSLITTIPPEIGKVRRPCFAWRCFCDSCGAITGHWRVRFASGSRSDAFARPPISSPFFPSQCVNIEKAVFAKNQISALPKEIGQIARLQYLDVSFNQLSALPETLALLEQLQCASLPAPR